MPLARHFALRAIGCACVASLCFLALAVAALGARPRAEGAHGYGKLRQYASATLERCGVTQLGQAPSASYSAMMTTLPGAAHMQMRFEILTRGPGDPYFHRPTSGSSPTVGAWRVSESGVTIFKGFDEVVNLTATNVYQARVRFRWVDGSGRVLRWTKRRAGVCKPAVVASAAPRGLFATR